MINFTLRTAFVLTVCMLLTAIVASGQKIEKIDVAEISNNGSNVSWLIKVPYERATLTVSAPNGEVHREEFEAGSIPSFSPVTNRAKYYANGVYTYQIVLTPVLSPGIKQALAQSRIDGTSEEVAADLRERGLLPEEMIETGTFRMLNGNIITGNSYEKEPENVVRQAETPKTKTETNTKTPAPNAGEPPVDDLTVIAMDLVVQGSQCLGIDCPNNPAFGFSTLILQENNLRIRFTDTSNTASFPTTDWEITINETTNGGQDFFAITDITNGKVPFTIEGNAPTNSLYVKDSGRIGLKTPTPAAELHMRDGDTATLRLEQDGSSGFTPQTWDVAGNEANFFIRDATNGSRLVFKIKPGAPTSSIFIQDNGRVGLQTEFPSRTLDVNGGIRFRSDVLEFPDGTTMATAPVGTGTSILDPDFSQTVFGGQAKVAPISTITPGSDFNQFSLNTNGQTGFASTQLNIPSNLNLANQTATHIIYEIRYKDEDGTGTNAQVYIAVSSVDISFGGFTSDVVFDSNTNAATGVNTVVVCTTNTGTHFNYEERATRIDASIVGTGTANEAEIFQIRVWKANGCP